jgi:SPP1 gp7 family putative phage head morphogenesis protein
VSLTLSKARAGIEAADAILLDVFGLSPLAKAPPNPLKPKGFDSIVLGALNAIKKAVAPTEHTALKAMLQKLERGWNGMTPEQRTGAIDTAAASYLKIARDAAPAVAKVIQGEGPAIVLATKNAANAEYKLKIHPNFDTVDDAAVHFAATSQANFIRDAMGKRAVAHSQTARDVVAKGLEAGFDKYEIAKELGAALNQTDAARSNAYWTLIASVFVSRSRSYATLRSFDEAGISAYQFEAVLDEVTSEICRFMHGKVFQVAPSIARFHDVEALSDPEGVKDLQPWASVGKTDDGGSALYYQANGQRNVIARVDSSGVGQKDGVGTYSHGMTNVEISDAGLSCPPLHGHCRSIMVPVFGAAAPRPEEPSAPARIAPPPKLKPPRTSPAPPPNKLPDNLADLVRPVPKPQDRETPGALKPLSPEQQAKQTAISVVNALPPAHSWTPLYVAPTTNPLPQDANGKPTFPFEAPHHATFTATLKKPPQDVPIGLIHSGMNAVNREEVINAIKKGPPDKMIFIKSGGKFWVAEGKGSATTQQTVAAVTASSYESKSSMTGHVIDLDAKAAAAAAKKPKPPKAPSAPAPSAAVPPPAPLPTGPGPVSAKVILAQNTGAARGSNKGGFYLGSDGVKRYVKFYDDPTQAYTEHLANQMYRAMGLDAPESQVFEHEGKIGYASVIFDGGKTLKDAGLNEQHAKEFMKGFVADVLTGNWDAVGTGFDNAMVLPNGRVARIDNGGTFLFRAKAGRKPPAVLNDVTEWDKFFDPGVNPYYAQAAQKAGIHGPEDMKAQINTGLAALQSMKAQHGNSWTSFVMDNAGTMKPDDRQKIIEMLSKRQALLEQKVAELNASKPPRPAAGNVAQFSTVLPRAGLKASDLPEHGLLGKMRAEHEKQVNAGKMPETGESINAFMSQASRDIAKAPRQAQSAIKGFTNGSYSDIRRSEENGHPDSDSNHLTQAYDHVPGVDRTVYRGIHLHDAQVTKSTLKVLMEDQVWGFGRDGKLATTSTSWNVEKALGFAGGMKDPGHGSLRVIYKVKNKTGIAIETISQYPKEREILASRKARFRTTGLSWVEGTSQRVLIVEAEEV